MLRNEHVSGSRQPAISARPFSILTCRCPKALPVRTARSRQTVCHLQQQCDSQPSRRPGRHFSRHPAACRRELLSRHGAGLPCRKAPPIRGHFRVWRKLCGFSRTLRTVAGYPYLPDVAGWNGHGSMPFTQPTPIRCKPVTSAPFRPSAWLKRPLPRTRQRGSCGAALPLFQSSRQLARNGHSMGFGLLNPEDGLITRPADAVEVRHFARWCRRFLPGADFGSDLGEAADSTIDATSGVRSSISHFSHARGRRVHPPAVRRAKFGGPLMTSTLDFFSKLHARILA
jgi:hypothetical protein